MNSCPDYGSEQRSELHAARNGVPSYIAARNGVPSYIAFYGIFKFYTIDGYIKNWERE